MTILSWFCVALIACIIRNSTAILPDCSGSMKWPCMPWRRDNPFWVGFGPIFPCGLAVVDFDRICLLSGAPGFSCEEDFGINSTIAAKSSSIGSFSATFLWYVSRTNCGWLETLVNHFTRTWNPTKRHLPAYINQLSDRVQGIGLFSLFNVSNFFRGQKSLVHLLLQRRQSAANKLN